MVLCVQENNYNRTSTSSFCVGDFLLAASQVSQIAELQVVQRKTDDDDHHDSAAPAPAPAPISSSVTVDVSSSAETSPFPHFWEEVMGSGHGALTLRDDWQRAATLATQELGVKAVRFHGLFNEDMRIVTRSSEGALVYNWSSIGETGPGFCVNQTLGSVKTKGLLGYRRQLGLHAQGRDDAEARALLLPSGRLKLHGIHAHDGPQRAHYQPGARAV